jgi:hypothetical protein
MTLVQDKGPNLISTAYLILWNHMQYIYCKIMGNIRVQILLASDGGQEYSVHITCQIAQLS